MTIITLTGQKSCCAEGVILPLFSLIPAPSCSFLRLEFMFIFAGAAVVELIFSRISGSLIWLTQRLLLCSGKEGDRSRLSGAGGRAALPLPPPGWPYVSMKSPSNYSLRALLTAFLEKVLRCSQQRRPRFCVPKWNEAKWTCSGFFILATGAGEGETPGSSRGWSLLQFCVGFKYNPKW